ncbi:cellulase family glycosylhydrolase [Streptomyces sp. R39]|uniref:Cellulase family glycosylhydrolase n=1 Tax=Streptomyces sp. R39 TaxID=3238631 RepID=A0AB39R5C0_9ACTN
MKDIGTVRHRTRRRAKGHGRLAALLLALLVVLGLSGGTAVAAVAGVAHPARPAIRVPATAVDAVAAMQPSWNVGNTLDAIPDETSWGNPAITKAMFDAVRDQGFRSVRIPVTWSGHQSATAPYAVDATFMNRVKQVVDWALADGLYVVLNVHHDSWQWIADMSTDHDGVLARFDSTWAQISTTFRNEPRTLLFESVNEPQFNNATDTQKAQFLNELNTSFHTIVRSSGGGNADRLLVLPTLGCTPSQDLMDNLAGTMGSLHDSNLVATVHYYGYWPFSVNIAGGTRYDATSQKDMSDAFTRMHDTFVAQGIPVYLGEYGLLSYPDYTHTDSVERGEALKYFEDLGYQARRDGVTTALWDAGSFLNRNTLQWRDPGMMDLIKASWSTRSGTASSDTVYVRKSTPITAQTLTLNPNGTSFQGLWQGSTQLASGRDYTVSGNQLTLTAGALTRLAGNRAYGVNATLRTRFSQGASWQISVISYDPPVLSDASGTSSSLTIPTQFRGDRLATMEARYADGSNAGPANWTPYQEFNSTFTPDYTGNSITLTSDFLSALTDGAPVTLTFDFWSGATATYHVTKSTGSVTGTAS